VLWGTDDHVIDPTSLLQHARRPGWTPRPIDDVGHLLPVEAPQSYAQAVCQWLADSRDTRGFGHPTSLGVFQPQQNSPRPILAASGSRCGTPRPGQ
jgi:hypothetical protein